MRFPYRAGICPSSYMCLGIWNWDAVFRATAVARWDGPLAREETQTFLDRQRPSGGVTDVLYQDRDPVDSVRHTTGDAVSLQDRTPPQPGGELAAGAPLVSARGSMNGLAPKNHAAMVNPVFRSPRQDTGARRREILDARRWPIVRRGLESPDG